MNDRGVNEWIGLVLILFACFLALAIPAYKIYSGYEYPTTEICERQRVTIGGDANSVTLEITVCREK